MEYILLAIAVFVGYVIGVVRTVNHFKSTINEAIVNSTTKREIPILTTEKHGDILYLFEKETNNFMCQGSSLEDLAKKLVEYKDINIAVVDHNSKPIWFINGEISEVPYES